MPTTTSSHQSSVMPTCNVILPYSIMAVTLFHGLWNKQPSQSEFSLPPFLFLFFFLFSGLVSRSNIITPCYFDNICAASAWLLCVRMVRQHSHKTQHRPTPVQHQPHPHHSFPSSPSLRTTTSVKRTPYR